jgi:ATP-binding cassette, subfamily B, bacterial
VTAPSYRSTLVTYLSPQKGKVALLAMALLGSIGLQLTIPFILRRFIDSAVAGAALSILVAAGVAYLVAGVLNQAFDAFGTYLGAQVGWTATNALREDLAEHLLYLDMGFHTSTTPGEVIERIDGDVTAISDFLSRFTVRLVGSGLLLAGVLIVCWLEDWRLGGAITVYVAAVLSLLFSMRSLAVAAAEEEREVSARLYGFIEERLSGIEDIRANGAGAFTMRKFIPVLRDYYNRTIAAWRKRIKVWVSANTAFWSGDALALALGVWLHTRGAITIGTAYLIFQFLQLVRRPIEQVTQELQSLQKAAGGIVRIDQLRRVKTRLTEDGRTELPAGPLSVEFDQVDFAYEAKAVLHQVSFRLQPGTVLGLLGRTGGGKTTITRLIGRLYEPDRGVVRVGGVDLRQVDPASLRRSIGVVSQEVQLFRASVRDNLTFFEPDISDGEIVSILSRAGLATWVDKLGLDTPLGSAGAGLSAGEQQLLAFARVFLFDPGVVILDEPSSRLDPATESILATATERLFSGRTVVIVAHRMETVRRAERIMVVEGGRVVEDGSRQDLAADPESRYAQLLLVGAGTDLLGGGDSGTSR